MPYFKANYRFPTYFLSVRQKYIPVETKGISELLLILAFTFNDQIVTEKTKKDIYV